jgi:hypothetical protein
VLQLARRGSQVVTAMILYRLFFSGSLKGWIKERGEIAKFSDLPSTIIANIDSFYHFAAGQFSPRWLAIFVPLTLIAAIFPANILARYVSRMAKSPWHRATVAAMGVLMFPVICLAVCGPMLMLRDVVLVPRVLIGVGALLCSAFIAMHLALRPYPSFRHFQYIYTGIWALGMAVVAAANGNAAVAQKAFESSIAVEFANDVASLQVKYPLHKYYVVGDIGLAPTTKHAAEQFPIINSLTFSYLKENYFWTRIYLLQYVPELEDAAYPKYSADDAFNRRVCSMPPVLVRSAYYLSVIDDLAVLRFRSAKCSMSR